MPTCQFVQGIGSRSRNAVTVSSSSSTLIPSRANRSAGNSATSSRHSGSTSMQGTHHVAQKLSSTTRPW